MSDSGIELLKVMMQQARIKGYFMPRYELEHDTTSIYEAAEVFRNNCLVNDGSLLSENHILWQLDLLGEISRALDAPVEGNHSFIDNLQNQIRGMGTNVIQLAAELLAVYFLFPSNVGGLCKRKVVKEVLSWAPQGLDLNPLLSRAFEHGIGSGGQGFNTYRHLECAFLVRFAIKVKELQPEDRQGIAYDPWRFMGFIDEIDDAESRQLRHMLLHLLFPDSFERISSGKHKRCIIKTFNGLVKGEGEDRQLLAIRGKLQTLMPNQTLDFYRPPLVAAWNDSSEGDLEDEVPLEIIQHKKQIVLYGPPGTGKTYRAKHLAERIIRSSAIVSMGAALYFQSQHDIEKALKYNIHRLQLHPAYSYEDFVRGLHISNGATEYRPGKLLTLIDTMNLEQRESRLPHVLILDEMNRTDLSRMLGECFTLLEDRNQTIELPAHNGEGAPLTLRIPDDLFVIGTMNLIDQSVEQIDFALRRRFLWQLCPFSAEAFMGAAESRWKDLNSQLDWSQVEDDFRKLAGAATALNKEIRDSRFLGAQYEIGHTYLLDVVDFLRNFLEPAPRRRNYLWARNGDAITPVVQVWNLSIRPLLEQYLAGLDANDRDAELNRLKGVLLTSPGDA